MRKVFLACWYVVLLTGMTCYGQDFALQQYTLSDGLPSNIVYDIQQDRQGFLWFCTDKGVARYNGIRFERFSTYDGLADNEIFGAQNDVYGRLWFNTYNGALCFYKDGVFHNAANTPFLRLPVRTHFIANIQPEPDSSVTFYFSSRPGFANVKRNRVTFIDPTGLGSFEAGYIHKISDTQYDFKQMEGPVFSVDTTGKVWNARSWRADLHYCHAQSMGQDYAYDKHYIYRVLPGDKLQRFIENRHDDLFRVFSQDSVFFVITLVHALVNDRDELVHGVRATGIARDMAGNYWLSTLGQGVYRLSRRIYAIREYKDMYREKIVFATTRDHDLFFATGNGSLYRLHQRQRVCLFDYEQWAKKQPPESLPGIRYIEHFPQCVLDRDANYFCYMDNGGIVVRNVCSERRQLAACFRFREQTLKNVCADDSGSIYLQSLSELWRMRYQLSSRKIQQETPEPVKRSRERVISLYKDPKGQIWYVTFDDLYRISGKNIIRQDRFHNMGLHRIIMQGDYLVGYTHTNQLLCMSLSDTQQPVDTIPGGNYIWDSFYPLDSRHILVSTNGLYCILSLPQGKGQKCTIGAVENPFIPTQAEYIYIDDEYCYLFKKGSVFKIRKDEFFVRPEPPGLQFTTIRTAHRSYTVQPEKKDPVIIPYAEAQKINVGFVALQFDGEGINYQYAISENGKDNWRTTKTEEINLVAPSYGEYYLKIRCRTLSGAYGAPVVLRLYIQKPYWARVWFLLLLLLLFSMVIAAVIYWLFKYGIRREKKKHDAEIRFLRSEYKAMNALMNPHFIFNSLNNVQGLINRNDKLAANQFLNHFSTMVRQNMHNIEAEMIPLQKELDLIVHYLRLEQLRFPDRFTYRITVDESVNTQTIMIAPLLLQPLVENAIKHGLLPQQSAGNEVTISIFHEAGGVRILIADNGVGLREHRDTQHQSFGLKNIRQRIAQLRTIHNLDMIFSLEEVKDAAGKVTGSLASLLIKQ